MNIGRCVMAWRGKGGVLSSLPRELTPSPSRGGLWRGWVSPPTCADSNASYQIGSGSKYIATRSRCSAGGWYAPCPCAASRNFCSGSEYSCSRSEEHTSELQSLMRISYAVFCLKKKKTHKH